MPRYYQPKLIPRARDLRTNATPQERRLWYEYLRQHPVRFQRQKAIGTFIADFYCHQARLIVELDGGQHYTEESKAYDANRTAYFESMGMVVVRFPNNDVDQRFVTVCRIIDITVKNRIRELNQRKEE